MALCFYKAEVLFRQRDRPPHPGGRMENNMKQESTQATSVNALNRAKMYQLCSFPMNNGATNVYYILTMNFIAYYANGVLGLLLAFATTMVTLMRAGDAFIDPIIGAIMDRTSTKWGNSDRLW